MSYLSNIDVRKIINGHHFSYNLSFVRCTLLMDLYTGTDNFNENFQKIRSNISNSENQQEIEFEIENLKNEYQILLNKNEELDHSLEIIKEKYLQESKRLKRHIKTNDEAIQALQISSQAAFSNSPIDESQLLQSEISQLIDDIANLKENETNLSLSHSVVRNEINEIEFLIESIPFNHQNLFNLAEQKIQHKLNKDIIDFQVLSKNIESEKKSLQIELNIAQSILSKWQSENHLFSQKILDLQQKRKEMNQKMKEIKQSNSLNSHTIQLTKLQKKLDQKNKEKENELKYLDYEYGIKIQKIENQLSITKMEIDERLKAIEVLNKKNIELAAEYEKAKENFKIKINQLKDRQSNEITDIKQRFQIEMNKVLNKQKKQFNFDATNFEFSTTLNNQ